MDRAPFATNESSEYDWKPFKKQIVDGVRALLKSYPKLNFFSLRPVHIELRYIDTFPASLVGKAVLFPFIEESTSLSIELPSMLTNARLFDPNAAGRFTYRTGLANRKHSELQLDLASAKNVDTGEDAVRMETRIISLSSDVPTFRSGLKSFSAIDSWLEMAHDITSPLFKELIKRDTLANYRIGK